MDSYIEKLDKRFRDYYGKFDSYLKNKEAYIYLTPNRLDIIFKITYFEFLFKINKTRFNKNLLYILYRSQKNILPSACSKSFAEYEREFKDLFDLKVKSGIDDLFLLPVDRNNEIIDTGNKLALSLVLNKEIDIIKFECTSNKFNLIELNNYFNLKKNNIITDYLIINYIKYHQNLRIILLFPCRKQSFEKQTLNSIKARGEIIIKKRLNINTLINAYYIVKNLYFGANWIGNLKNNFKGALWKAKCCFEGTNGELDVLLFYPKNKKNSEPRELKKMKEEIRSYHNVHYHSIHSSDNQSVTLRYTKLFFHEASSKILANKNINQNNFAFSGSMTLAAMGIRAPNDIDIVHDEDFNFNLNIFKKSPFNEYGGLHSHNEHISNYLPNYEIVELIYNPKYFFYYMGFKFINPKIIYELKIKRYNRTKKKKDIKDINDIKNFFKTM